MKHLPAHVFTLMELAARWEELGMKQICKLNNYSFWGLGLQRFQDLPEPRVTRTHG